ncbi:conserved protein, unknown function [Hepatocystis sp. ex Piliocolobus tephrosceles]|nr:conserved protein, unknown function [Hepatocystis sp. ex Piliocolobus tephrosceles]
MNYQNLKCSELKDLLAKRGLPSHGKKNELLERLLKHEENSLNPVKSYAKDSNNNSNNNTNNSLSEKNISNKNINLKEKTEDSCTKEFEGNHNINYIESEKKKNKISVNEKEFNKSGLSRMKGLFKNILTSNSNTKDSKDYEQSGLKNDSTMRKNENMNNNQGGRKYIENNNEENGKKTAIPVITFSKESICNQSILQTNTTINNPYLTEEKKKEIRKKRFDFLSNDERLESRAKRFSIVTHKMEEEKKRKREERFGLNLGNLNDFEKKKQRAERFGIIKESDKLKARALRFGIAQ